MDAIEKCKCQHCDQNIEFDFDAAGTSVNCPSCGLETILFIRSNEPSPKRRPPQPILSPKQKIQAAAERFSSGAAACCAFAVFAALITLVVFLLESSSSGEFSIAPLAIGATVVSGFLGTAGWLYLIAQIVHIRANTHQE